MSSFRSWFNILVVAGFLLGSTATVPMVQAQQGLFAYGTVVALLGSPHLWIADPQGVLHWAGDTRALAGKHVDWGRRVVATVAQLQTFTRGDPWLTAGLLKEGDPIYLVKWESDWPEPRLLHIQSIGDVELFGINGSNYGNFVLDRAAWELRYGISAAGLQRSTLAAATPDRESTRAALYRASSIHEAAHRGDVDSVNRLIQAGADVNAKDSFGRTALHAAIGGGYPEVVRILVNAGADVSAEDAVHIPAIHQAVRNDNPEIVQILVNAGADVNSKDTRGVGSTAIYKASFIGNREIVRILVDAGADADTALRRAVGICGPGWRTDLLGIPGLTLARTPPSDGKPEMVRILVDAGADANQTFRSLHPLLPPGNPILYHAAEYCNPDIVRILLDAGADVNARGRSGRTVLDRAIERGNQETVQILIGAGAQDTR